MIVSKNDNITENYPSGASGDSRQKTVTQNDLIQVKPISTNNGAYVQPVK
jgi:hypothetical protein